MRLRDVIKDIGDDVILHVGSRTSFFYVGTKNIGEEIDTKLLDEARKFLNKYSKRLKNIDARVPKIEGNGYEDVQKFCANLAEFSKQIHFANEGYRRYFDYIKDYVNVLDREVKEMYPRIQRDGMVIIVEGDEDGDYWDYEEVLRGQGQ